MRKRAKRASENKASLPPHRPPQFRKPRTLPHDLFFFLKMRKLARQKPILDFNHIDPRISKEELEEIQKLYKHYKKLWWCFKKVHQKQKLLDLVEKISSSALVAGGVLAGGATLNPIVLGVISGLGLVLKTIQEAKNRGKKIEKAKFAFTNYEKALSNLKFALRGGEFDPQKFLVEMETLDGIVIDFGLNQEKFEKVWKEKFAM